MKVDLDRFPRVHLAHLPTPLEPLERLSRHLRGPRIWIKRDDCTGLATGGNKTRKLEFLIGAALDSHADTVITFGAVQSNHARQTAAACAKFGLECHLVLSRAVASDQPDYESTGNVLLDRLFGANLHFVSPADATPVAAALRRELEQRRRTVYVIPTGGSNTIGALGYVECAQEVLDQANAEGFRPDLVVHASSSGGTQAGLAAGLHGSGVTLLGVNVSDPSPASFVARLKQLTDATASLLSLPGQPPEIQVRHDHLGPGYGIPSAAALESIRTLAHLEGIPSDPVYTGKAVAALFDEARSGRYGAGSNLVYLHTGGVAVC